MKIFLITATISALALTACANNEDPYYKIKIAKENEVAGCKYIGNLSSSSHNYGLFNETASEARIKNAKQEGYDLGANRIVLAPSEEIGNTTKNEGKAYLCP